MKIRWWLAPALAVARRPDLWRVALVQLARLARPGWWRRPPFLPLPAMPYLRFRLETAYGELRPPAGADVVDYLRWCREWPR